MKTLDDAWNGQDWDTFNKRHAKEVAVYWPGQPEPTRGQHSHQEEAGQFFKTFLDNHVRNNPYMVLFGEGDWPYSVTEVTGTMTGPMPGPDGTTIEPTNKSFEVEFCTVAHWNEKGEIVQEQLFYDLVGLGDRLVLGEVPDSKVANVYIPCIGVRKKTLQGATLKNHEREPFFRKIHVCRLTTPLFVSHGPPTLPLEDVPAREFLTSLGDRYRNAQAVLCISAHWNTSRPSVNAVEAPETINDFYGFPAELYEQRYNARGSPDLARQVTDLLRGAGLSCDLDDRRGLDHGAWVPLMPMFPNADIPVVQLSIQ